MFKYLMSEFWYYAEGDETRGPIAFDPLLKLLSQRPSPRGVLVWREGFANWTAAENVREIVEKLIRPPPLPHQPFVSVPNQRVPVVTETTKQAALDDTVSRYQQQFRKDKLAENETVGRYQQQFQKLKPELPSDQNANTRGRIAFLIVFMIVLSVGAYFTNQLYSNSVNGIASVIGELSGAWLLLTALTWSLRKSSYTAAVVLAVAALSVGFNNRGKLQEVWDSKLALQAMPDPTQLDKTLSQNPENKILRLFAMANKITEETVAATTKLSDEIEPAGLSRDINFATATRNDLETLRRDLKTAETNTTSFIPRYLVLLKDEHDKIAVSASSLNIDRGLVTGFLKGLDEARVKSVTFSSNMMEARSEFYRAYGNYAEFLTGEFDNYKVDANGKFLFAKQAKLEKFNVLGNTMNAASQRVATLEVERKQFEKSQQEKREQLAKGK
jgi:GYF domain 2